jgi:xanthine/uracil permease
MTRRIDSTDLVGALLWFVVIVPPAFGFWLVAGDLVGVEPGDYRILLTASMLAVGIATLLQVTAGYLLPVYEGPAGNYLAAVAVLAVSEPTPAQATGGLLIAGALVFALGALRVDRVLARFFTPPVVQAFLFVVIVIAMPPTVDRALELSPEAPVGTAAGWLAVVVMLGLAITLQRIRALSPYALLVALVASTGVFFAVDGVPDPRFESGGIATPAPFPWGSPEVDLSVAAPFVIAAVLASFNTIASMRVMSTAIDEPIGRGAARRGLVVDGGTQALNAGFGNVLGHVPRLDSAGVVRMIGNPRRLPLALAGGAVIVLSFVGPVIDLLALLPVPVSASLLGFFLGAIALQGLRQVMVMDPRSRWLVFVPAVVPCIVWLPLADGLPETAQLLTNPLLLGTVLAVLLDHVVPRTALEQRAT